MDLVIILLGWFALGFISAYLLAKVGKIIVDAATAAYAQDDIFGYSSPRLDAPSGNIPSDKQKCQPKAQHEFTIKGVKIMAASKKDAIKKYNHRKK